MKQIPPTKRLANTNESKVVAITVAELDRLYSLSLAYARADAKLTAVAATLTAFSGDTREEERRRLERLGRYGKAALRKLNGAFEQIKNRAAAKPVSRQSATGITKGKADRLYQAIFDYAQKARLLGAAEQQARPRPAEQAVYVLHHQAQETTWRAVKAVTGHSL
jgi:hypothetical protein